MSTGGKENTFLLENVVYSVDSVVLNGIFFNSRGSSSRECNSRMCSDFFLPKNISPNNV